ncbi:unnamed protein product [Adineta steineri]|uniref:Uncharacterized protein n=1 Tax=Adineta steineri TaxID=433720 RepID=A0A815VES3_9BILA|nr:unnamed protein product [Adineta steineri]
MLDGPLQFFFMFGILQHGSKMPVNLTFRPQLEYRLFYHTIDTLYELPNMKRIVKRQEIESVEQIAAINKIKIHITNINVTLDPANTTESNILLKRPYFDRLEEYQVPGDFRSRDLPFGYKWMLFPSPESLMTPEQNLYEGQKWAVKMAGDAFEINYELKNIDHKQHQATIEGHDGVCRNGLDGYKLWNGTWIVDTHTGIIKRRYLELNHQVTGSKKITRMKSTKVLVREEPDKDKIFDYEIDHDDL